MAVIDLRTPLSQNAEYQTGQAVGQNFLAQILEIEQKRRQQEQMKKQWSDLQNMLGVLGKTGPRNDIFGQISQGQAPQTQQGLQMYMDLAAQQAKPPEPYTLGKDQARFIGGEKIAQGPRGQSDRWSKPEKRGSTYIQRNLDTGKIRKVWDEGQGADQWSEPYRKGNQWVQRNEKTGKIRKAYTEDDVSDLGLAEQRKLRNYQSAIKTIMSKYDISPNLMQFTESTPDGGMTINYEKFREFQENPYQILKQKARTNKKARRDLKNVDHWMNKITEVAGGQIQPEDLPGPEINKDDPLGLFE